ncbi:hypothetical protein ACPOL_2664 [Acidisarcina polymorpha]|uniref:Uncharacterized protein n=2 Tax=Acidisarcina polymorpha TaxID=2211140 RepID=A0A2Z5FZQ2_9BACT|nr:hypothetical protein ACPOL_2664 [Acidisarcina polymorpha]
MATVTQFWEPHNDSDGLYQADSTAEWTWQLGDNQYFWSYAIRPYQADMKVEITRQWTTSDNNLTQVQHFLVTVSGFARSEDDNGGLLQFTAIKVQEP